MNASRLSQICDTALEAGWLLGVTITPVFFNVYSSRVFEPDKLTTLRALAVVLAVFWLVRFIDERLHKEVALRFSLKTPMVLPALLTIAVYLLSSLFSLVPYTSLIGSYQRLQGTFTLFGYLVIFFVILTSLRTREQLSRLITVLILNSLPVSLYGIVQHSGLDPLPWAGDVTSRVASNMGNSIFVAAYLILIVPLTASRIVESFRDILSREDARVSDILRSSGYIFLFAVQVLTIWYAQSRGPWLGTVTAMFLFPYLGLLLLQRQAGPGDGKQIGDILKGIGFGLACLVVAGGLAALAYWALSGPMAVYIALGLALLSFGGMWLYFIVERKGWRWLWIGWGSVGLTVALALILVNVPGSLQTQVRKIESLRRLTTITELQSGTGRVRGLIWQGAVDLISVHEPIQYPDGTEDKFNFLRPLVGYGPESMYVAYNSFYPPILGHYESRTASPDRSHNETLDSLVITGVLGMAVYLFTFGSFFAWGFHWLGLLKSRSQLLTYMGLDIFFAVVFFFIAWRLEGAYLFAVAIPLGIIVGTMVYLTVTAFWWLFREGNLVNVAATPHPHAILIVGLLAGVIAHFVEINFGIAIAATRTTFWAYTALLVVLGLKLVPDIGALQNTDTDENKTSRRSRTARMYRSSNSVSPWVVAVVLLALSAVFLLGTLAYDFINNPERLSDPIKIFSNSLTMKYYPEPTRAYGALMIFIFTGALFGIVGLSEYDREGVFEPHRKRQSTSAVFIYIGISLVGVLFFGVILAGHQAALTQVQVTTIEGVIDVAVSLAALLSRYYAFIFVIFGLMALTALQGTAKVRTSGHILSISVLVVFLLLSVPIIRAWCFDLIRADIVYKQGGVFANSRAYNDKQIGIQHFERALEYTPREDYYNLFLGKAYLELAQGLPDETSVEQRESVFLKTEQVLIYARELNPLNTDHSANLARFYKSWAARIAMDLSAEGLTDDRRTTLNAQYQALLERSLAEYKTALILSPHNPIIWNELAQLYAIDLKDEAKFQETITKSLAIDVDFEQTWMLLGDMRSSKGDIDGAIAAYQRSLDVSNNCTVRRVIGTLHAQQSRWEEAAENLELAVEKCASSDELWEMYRVLAITYANLGRGVDAVQFAQQSLALAPEAQKSVVQQLLDQLVAPPEE